MITIGKHRIKNHMTLEYDFSGIRILNSGLIPADWHLSVDLVAIDKKGKSSDDVEFNATLAYQKLFFWLDTNLPDILMVNVSNEDDLYIANLSSNIMLYCPDEPYDDLIAELLHSKLVALADGSILVGELRIKATDMSVKYTFDCQDTEYDLPATTEEYYTEGKARDTNPWWARNDGFCFEFIRPDDATISDEELYKDIVDPMEEFDRLVNEAADKYGNSIREPARIVQVERWRPKKV